MEHEPQPTWNWPLYWLLLLAVLCGGLVITGEIREALRWLNEGVDGALR